MWRDVAWHRRLTDHGIAHDATEQRFGEQVLPLRDPDGLRLEITNYRQERRDRHDRWESLAE